MNRSVLIGGVAALIAIAAVVSYISDASDPSRTADEGPMAPDTVPFDIDPPEPGDAGVARMHGSVVTATGSPVLGDPDAPITLIEFGDYQCPLCGKWFRDTKPAIQENYIDTGKANLVFMDMALLGLDSPKAAQATYCAEEQGMYWEYHDQLYSSQVPRIDSGWADSEHLKAFAAEIGMDADPFSECLDSERYQQRVEDNIREGLSHGVERTPTFIIVLGGGEEVTVSGAQPYAAFAQVMG